MEFSSRASELATLLESKMTHFSTNLKLDEIGRVVSVGDGIARVYGLNEGVQSPSYKKWKGKVFHDPDMCSSAQTDPYKPGRDLSAEALLLDSEKERKKNL